jgi:hypothetical protein
MGKPMSSSLRIKTTVLPGHRIEVCDPELRDGQSVEILVMPSNDIQKAGRMELLKMSLEDRRRILAEQASELDAEYGPDPDREEWQGGDIVAD